MPLLLGRPVRSFANVAAAPVGGAKSPLLFALAVTKNTTHQFYLWITFVLLSLISYRPVNKLFLYFTASPSDHYISRLFNDILSYEPKKNRDSSYAQ